MAHTEDSPYLTPDFSTAEQQWLATEAQGADNVEAALAAVIRREAVIDAIAENGGWGNAGTEARMDYWSTVDEARRLKAPGS
ncbi:hypothetical protein E6P97_00420 [Patescibacteria group bacterium]|nr:MAG: hypothetical protein E6P97_00420 [Patescibacteria group bacterium]